MPFDLVYSFAEDPRSIHETDRRTVRVWLGALRKALPKEHRAGRLVGVEITPGEPTEDESFLFETFSRIAFHETSMNPNDALVEALRLLEVHRAEQKALAIKGRGERELVVAFVQGAKWWEWQKEGATMWQADQDRAEKAALEKLAAGRLGKTIDEIIGT